LLEKQGASRSMRCSEKWTLWFSNWRICICSVPTCFSRLYCTQRLKWLKCRTLKKLGSIFNSGKCQFDFQFILFRKQFKNKATICRFCPLIINTS
jgi:hypothetical protein